MAPETGGDCQSYLNNFGLRDTNGRVINWVPSYLCQQPPPLTGSGSLYTPACFVFPASAQSACPGSPDPSGPPTQSETLLCQAYSELFGRAPDAAGYTYWASQLGTSSLACMKKALAPGASAGDCATFQNLNGFAAPSVACGGHPSSSQASFGCQ